MVKKKRKPPDIVRLLWKLMPLIVVLLATVAIGMFAVRRANGETFTVRTFDELRKATTQPTADVVVIGTIKCPDTITVTSRTLRMTSDKQTSGLDFGPLPIAANFGYTNGLDVHSDNATLYGLTIKGFNGRGGCVKFYGFGTLLVDRVTFSDIGTKVRPMKVTPGSSAEDAHYNNVIASHGTAANVIVTNSAFRRCVWTAHDWSHCVYVSAGNVVVTDNTFEGCGNPVTIEGQTFVAGNKVTLPIATPDRYGKPVAAFFATLRSGDRCMYLRNVLSGTFLTPMTGSPYPPTHFVDWNDYSGMTLAGPFASDTKAGKWISTDEWKKLGFDGASKWP